MKGETSYFSFCSSFLISLLQKPFGNLLPSCARGGEKQTPLPGGHRRWGTVPPAQGSWLLKLGHFITTRHVPPVPLPHLHPSKGNLVADGLRSCTAKGETPKYAAEPWNAAACRVLVGYKTPRSIFECPGTEWLYPVSARCDFYLWLLT